MTAWVGRAAVMVAATLLQLTWVPRLAPPGSPFPDLVVVLLAVFVWARAFPPVLILAVAAGLVIDLGQATPLGLHSLAFATGAFTARLLVERLEPSPPVVLGSGVSASLASGFAFLAAQAIVDRTAPPLAAGAELVVTVALVNAVLLLLVWKPLTLLFPPAAAT